MSRIFPDWIEGFLELTKDKPSPEIFRKWTALSTISAALERKVYCRINKLNQYANLYVILVGPPGTGKTVAIRAGRSFVRKHADLHLASDRITRQAFYDEIEAAGNTLPSSGLPLNGAAIVTHHSLSCMIGELGVFLHKNDYEFMADLSDLFDNPEDFSYKTKTAGENHASNVWINIIAGTTPFTLKDFYSIDSIENGFTARVIPVWVDRAEKMANLFPEEGEGEDLQMTETPLFKKLLADFEQIGTMVGNILWTPEAKEFLSNWYSKDLRPFPEEAQLQHYVTRRLTHVTKLALIISAARSDKKFIELEHIESAKEMLLNVEKDIGSIVEHLGDNRYIDIQKGVVLAVNKVWDVTGKSCPEHLIRKLLLKSVQPAHVSYILEELISARMIKVFGKKPDRKLFPIDWTEKEKK